MILLIDSENCAIVWWEIARAKAHLFSPAIATWLNDWESEIEVTEDEAAEFLKIAQSLPGWNDGPDHAPNPVILEKERK
jgi:hypothetical protein